MGELVLVAVKLTVRGATPFVGLAAAVRLGGVVVFLRNHGVAVGSVLKKARSSPATLRTPLLEGCVNSSRKSEHSHTNPSERGVMPSAHKYGPHDNQGATTGPFVGL